MNGPVKKILKRASYISIPLRFMRQIRPTWDKAVSEFTQDQLFEKTLARRKLITAEYLSQHPIKKLQIGTGTNPLPDWLNADIEPVNEEIIFLDATRRFPFENCVFDYVFSEHMIEHIHYKDGMRMLDEVFRVLKPGGKIRLSTPDINKLVGLFSQEKTGDQRRYIAWKCGQNMGLYSPEPSQLQRRRNEWDIDHLHIKRFYPNLEEDGVCFIVNHFFRGYGHQFLYDRNSLRAIVEEAGFEEISMSFVPNESDDEHLRNIESHACLIGEDMNTFETMILQAVRP